MTSLRAPQPVAARGREAPCFLAWNLRPSFHFNHDEERLKRLTRMADVGRGFPASIYLPATSLLTLYSASKLAAAVAPTDISHATSRRRAEIGVPTSLRWRVGTAVSSDAGLEVGRIRLPVAAAFRVLDTVQLQCSASSYLMHGLTHNLQLRMSSDFAHLTWWESPKSASGPFLDLIEPAAYAALQRGNATLDRRPGKILEVDTAVIFSSACFGLGAAAVISAKIQTKAKVYTDRQAQGLLAYTVCTPQQAESGERSNKHVGQDPTKISFGFSLSGLKANSAFLNLLKTIYHNAKQSSIGAWSDVEVGLLWGNEYNIFSHWNRPCPWAIAWIERKQQYPLLPAMPCKDLFRNFPSTEAVFWEEWEIRWSRATIPASPRNTHGLNRPQLVSNDGGCCFAMVHGESLNSNSIQLPLWLLQYQSHFLPTPYLSAWSAARLLLFCKPVIAFTAQVHLTCPDALSPLRRGPPDLTLAFLRRPPSSPRQAPLCNDSAESNGRQHPDAPPELPVHSTNPPLSTITPRYQHHSPLLVFILKCLLALFETFSLSVYQLTGLSTNSHTSSWRIRIFHLLLKYLFQYRILRRTRYTHLSRSFVIMPDEKDPPVAKPEEASDCAIDSSDDADDEYIETQMSQSELKKKQQTQRRTIQHIVPFKWSPLVLPLTESNLESCVALEDAAFPDPIPLRPFSQSLLLAPSSLGVPPSQIYAELASFMEMRVLRVSIVGGRIGRFMYRLATCSDISTGLFCSVVPAEAEAFPLSTMTVASPVETGRANGAKLVLLGHAVATLGDGPVVSDDDMAYPDNWRDQKSAKSTDVGHKIMGRTLCLHSFAIDPKLQGLGLGKLLMKSYLQQINNSGVADRIALICKDWLVSYYQRFGFKRVGPSKASFAGGGWNDMVIELSGPPKKGPDALKASAEYYDYPSSRRDKNAPVCFETNKPGGTGSGILGGLSTLNNLTFA
ncbi:acetyltransferase [Colletotrichum lupini]|uniref:Acetyltransferase n=1 Tax=Colletotrichum lupini TaxID=145971 RepID=A0A9Q8T5J7_9PEZI|nr:acetyltransferase [Colletotrichum lupini]UQC89415.1 acetyltransferase [Colletotrichum lupini]